MIDDVDAVEDAGHVFDVVGEGVFEGFFGEEPA